VRELWLTEIRKHLGFFALAAVPAVVLGALRLPLDADWVDILFALYIMCSSTALTTYAAWVLFSYLVRGHDELLHLPPANRGRASAVKALALGALLYGYYLLYASTDALAADATPNVGYGMLTKAVSIASYLALVFLIVVATCYVRRTPVDVLVAMVLYLSVTVATGLGVWFAIAGDDWSWSIGVSAGASEVSQYLNIVPILIERRDGLLAPTDHLVSLAANLVLGAIALVAGRLLLRAGRFDFYAR
jgi:hypothetical protein